MTLPGVSCSRSDILLMALLAAPIGAIGAFNVQAPSTWAISTLALGGKPSIEKATSRPCGYFEFFWYFLKLQPRWPTVGWRRADANIASSQQTMPIAPNRG